MRWAKLFNWYNSLILVEIFMYHAMLKVSIRFLTLLAFMSHKSCM